MWFNLMAFRLVHQRTCSFLPHLVMIRCSLNVKNRSEVSLASPWGVLSLRCCWHSSKSHIS